MKKKKIEFHYFDATELWVVDDDVTRSTLLAVIGIELRHSSSIGPWATSSLMKHDSDSSPMIPENYLDDDENRDRHSSKDRNRPFSWYNFHSWCLFFGNDSRVSPYNSKISLCLLFILVLASLISTFSIINHWVSALVSCHFWLCAFWGIWFVFLWIFFFLYLCLCLVAQKMWKRNENLDFGWSLKKPTKFGTV